MSSLKSGTRRGVQYVPSEQDTNLRSPSAIDVTSASSPVVSDLSSHQMAHPEGASASGRGLPQAQSFDLSASSSHHHHHMNRIKKVYILLVGIVSTFGFIYNFVLETTEYAAFGEIVRTYMETSTSHADVPFIDLCGLVPLKGSTLGQQMSPMKPIGLTFRVTSFEDQIISMPENDSIYSIGDHVCYSFLANETKGHNPDSYFPQSLVEFAFEGDLFPESSDLIVVMKMSSYPMSGSTFKIPFQGGDVTISFTLTSLYLLPHPYVSNCRSDSKSPKQCEDRCYHRYIDRDNKVIVDNESVTLGQLAELGSFTRDGPGAGKSSNSSTRSGVKEVCKRECSQNPCAQVYYRMGIHSRIGSGRMKKVTILMGDVLKGRVVHTPMVLFTDYLCNVMLIFLFWMVMSPVTFLIADKFVDTKVEERVKEMKLKGRKKEVDILTINNKISTE